MAYFSNSFSLFSCIFLNITLSILILSIFTVSDHHLLVQKQGLGLNENQVKQNTFVGGEI